MKFVVLALLAAACAIVAVLVSAAAQVPKDPTQQAPPDKPSPVTSMKGKEIDMDTLETATFAAGCFWGVEAAFREVKGVKATSVGYTGGSTKNPSYHQVCYDDTGHAEAVEVVFDPHEVSYEDLLEVFWKNHNPTTKDRQGPDVGSQYRSAIFFHSPEQEAAAKKSREKLANSGKFSKSIVTEILPAKPFWRAEEYHQQYLEKRGLASCHI